jgi:hypothetical protein
MAGKVVFRGTAALYVLYQDESGRLQSWDGEVPFSQFADLEGDYEDDVDAQILPAVTNLELDVGDDGNLHLKAGLTGQYIVFDHPVIEAVEDAYSPQRQVMPIMQPLTIPMVLDRRCETIRLEEPVSGPGQTVDVYCTVEHPQSCHGEMEVCGTFQVLRYDPDGMLQGQTLRTQNRWQMIADDSIRLSGCCVPAGNPQLMGSSAHADVQVMTEAVAGQGMSVVTGLTLGEKAEPDPDRASVILRRAGAERLWDLAKRYGSTMDAICRANHLTGEPEAERMLLIPVL